VKTPIEELGFKLHRNLKKLKILYKIPLLEIEEHA